jgi:hypothetical protein
MMRGVARIGLKKFEPQATLMAELPASVKKAPEKRGLKKAGNGLAVFSHLDEHHGPLIAL